MLGPCAYYGVFGRPGAPIEQWLLNSEFWQAADADWLSPPKPPSVLDEDDLSLTGESTSYLLEVIAALSYQGLGFTGSACARGDLTVCRRIILSSDAGGQHYARHALGDASIVRMPNAYYDMGFDRWYLADLVRARGRQSFDRFWHSNLPLDSAFTSVYGMSVDDWTRGWLQERRPGLHAGPGVRTASVLWGLLSIVGFVAIGAAFAQRRRIV